MLFYHVHKLDKGGDQFVLVVGIEDKESYVANVESPESNESYETFRAPFADPEWLDGEIVASSLE